MCPQRFRKVSPFSFVPNVHVKQRFQKVPVWRAFSKSSVFIDRFHWIRVDGSRIRQEKVAFSNENGYECTVPQCPSLYINQALLLNSFSIYQPLSLAALEVKCA